MEKIVIDRASSGIGVGSAGAHEALLETKAFHDAGYAVCLQFHEAIARRHFPLWARD